MDVELLIPAAIGGVITEKNAGKIRAPLIIEAANAPVRPAADKILESQWRDGAARRAGQRRRCDGQLL